MAQFSRNFQKALPRTHLGCVRKQRAYCEFVYILSGITFRGFEAKSSAYRRAGSIAGRGKRIAVSKERRPLDARTCCCRSCKHLRIVPYVRVYVRVHVHVYGVRRFTRAGITARNTQVWHIVDTYVRTWAESTCAGMIWRGWRYTYACVYIERRGKKKNLCSLYIGQKSRAARFVVSPSSSRAYSFFQIFLFFFFLNCTLCTCCSFLSIVNYTSTC